MFVLYQGTKMNKVPNRWFSTVTFANEVFLVLGRYAAEWEKVRLLSRQEQTL